MASLPESSTWSPNIYQLELADPVKGGPVVAGTGGGGGTHADGIANLQAKQLADRTKYLDDQKIAGVEVALDGGLVGTRKRINLLTGAYVTLTVVDDASAVDGDPEEIQITIAVVLGAGVVFSGARVSNVNVNTIPSATNYNPGFDTEQYDTDSYHDAGLPSRFVIPVAGIQYDIGALIRWDGHSIGLRRLAIRNVNTATDLALDRMAGMAVDQTQQLVTPELMTALHSVELEVHQTSGVALNIAGGRAERFFYIQKAGKA